MAQTGMRECHLYLRPREGQSISLEQLADACTRNHTGRTPSEQCIGWTGSGSVAVEVAFPHIPTLAGEGFIKCQRLTAKSVETLKALDMAFVRSQGEAIGGVTPADLIGLHQPLVSTSNPAQVTIKDIFILELDTQLEVPPDHVKDSDTTLVVVDVPRYSEMDITEVTAICDSVHTVFEHAHVMHASQILRTWKRILLQSIMPATMRSDQTLAQKTHLLCDLCVRVLRLPPQFMTDANAMSIYMAELVVNDTSVCLFAPTPAPQHSSPKFPSKISLPVMATAVVGANISWEMARVVETPVPGFLALCPAKDVSWLREDPRLEHTPPFPTGPRAVFGCAQHAVGALNRIASMIIKKLSLAKRHDPTTVHDIVWAIMLRAATDDSPLVCAALDVVTGVNH